MSKSNLRTFEKYYAVVKVSFPTGKYRCEYCEFYERYEKRCRLTHNVCFYPNECENEDCPLMPIEKEVSA